MEDKDVMNENDNTGNLNDGEMQEKGDENKGSSDTEKRESCSYYTTTGKKVGDFCLGFFGVIAASIGGAFIPVIGNVLVAVAGIILAVYFMRKGNRRYLGIGILAAVIIPFLLAGACFALLYNFR